MNDANQPDGKGRQYYSRQTSVSEQPLREGGVSFFQNTPLDLGTRNIADKIEGGVSNFSNGGLDFALFSTDVKIRILADHHM